MQLSAEECCAFFEFSTGLINKNIIKKQYRKLCSKYHPDKNPQGLEKMQYINVAYDILKKHDAFFYEKIIEKPKEYHDDIPKEKSERRYHKKVYEIVSYLQYKQNITHFLTEDSIVIIGNTYPYREDLKQFGCRWDPIKRYWFRKLYR